MKPTREFINEIRLNKANVEYIAETGIINGSLLIDLEEKFKEYALQEVKKHLEIAASQINKPNPFISEENDLEFIKESITDIEINLT